MKVLCDLLSGFPDFNHKCLCFQAGQILPPAMHFFFSIKKKQRFRKIWSDHTCLFCKLTHFFTKGFCINGVFHPIVSENGICQYSGICICKSFYKFQSHFRLIIPCQKSGINSVRTKIHFFPLIHNLFHMLCIIIVIIGRKSRLRT